MPARVPLLALAVLALPLLLPGDLSVPEAAVAVIGAVILASAGLDHPSFSPARGQWLTAALAFAAIVLVLGQTVLDGKGSPPLVELPGVTAGKLGATPRAPERSRAGKARAKRTRAARAERSRSAPAVAPAERTRSAPATSKPAPATVPAAPAPAAPAPAAPSPAAPSPAAPTPSPTLREGTPVPAGAERFVRDYYAALDARRFAAAWKMLAPGVQSGFGGFAAWQRGYARTLSSAPGSLRVTPAGAGATVGLTLRAGDRGGCGETVVRRFAVTWRLARTEAGWRATAATARKLDGPEPAAAC